MKNKITSRPKSTNYEIYRTVKTKDEFYKNWSEKDLTAMGDELKERVYAKYVIKCRILQRDSFTCQNVPCQWPNSKLTIHHIKHRRNNGKDTDRNLITICKTCHDRFNKCKDVLLYGKTDNVPSHVRGITQKLTAPVVKIDWKAIRAQMKEIRKELKRGGKISPMKWEMIEVLMRFLQVPYYELNGDDDI